MTQPQADTPHLKYLDSARGIAALMVFGNHYIDRAFQERMNVKYFAFLFNSNDAVSFFFVLSGFVLSYKYIVLGKPLDMKKFYVNRFFRLFPAYFLTVFACALLFHHLDLDRHFFFDIFFRNKTGFWGEALLLRFHNHYYYPGWTLTIEMLGSFLIPFYIVLALYNKRLIPWLIVVTLIIGNNLYYSYMFLFGFICTCNYGYITSDAFKQTKWYKFRVPILIAAIILFSIRQINNVSPFGPDYFKLTDYLGIEFFTYTGLACFAFLVAILVSKRTQRFLQKRPLVFIGKISYSIYLVHVFVVGALFIRIEPYLIRHNYDALSVTAATLICIPAVIVAATAMYYFVELPFIRIGKRITGAMRASLVVGRNNG